MVRFAIIVVSALLLTLATLTFVLRLFKSNTTATPAPSAPATPTAPAPKSLARRTADKFDDFVERGEDASIKFHGAVGKPAKEAIAGEKDKEVLETIARFEEIQLIRAEEEKAELQEKARLLREEIEYRENGILVTAKDLERCRIAKRDAFLNGQRRSAQNAIESQERTLANQKRALSRKKAELKAVCEKLFAEKRVVEYDEYDEGETTKKEL